MKRNIICFKCKSKIEDKFSFCPHCGGELLKSPFKQEVSTQQTKGIGWLGYLIFFMVALLACELIIREGFINLDREPLSKNEASEADPTVLDREPLSTSVTPSQNESNQVFEADPIADELTLDAAPAIGEESLGMRIAIPMESYGEQNKYFLTSHHEVGELHTITYTRVGNESDVFAKMEINCNEEKIRRTSTEDPFYLTSPDLDLGNWYTPTPDWTDKDIYNFICSS